MASLMLWYIGDTTQAASISITSKVEMLDIAETDGVAEIHFLSASHLCKIREFLQESQDQIKNDAIAHSNTREDSTLQIDWM